MEFRAGQITFDCKAEEEREEMETEVEGFVNGRLLERTGGEIS